MTSNQTLIRRLLAMMATGVLLFGVAACGDDEPEAASSGSGSSTEETASEEKLSGKIAIDGSSTVFPYAQAAAELFNEDQPDVQVTVGQSGTGGGFEKFCAGETDISNASRPIKDDEEVPICEKAGIAFKEVQVANDGIAVVTNKALTIDCLKVDELKAIWNKGSKDDKYSLYGPGTDSGTFDFFTDVINGEEGAIRDDFEASEDDNQLVTGVSGTENGMGYFGFSYYEANTDKLNLVPIDGGDGCVTPSPETIQDGSYKPLSRPIFMYPSEKALARPEVKAFMTYVTENQAEIAEAAKFVSLTDEQSTEAKTAVGG
jgi:phosphate transport system substrate-binding protein